MPVAIVWSDHYLTGVQSLDEQHRRLFVFLDEIMHAGEDCDHHAPELAARNFLNYARMHVSFELSLLESAGYPGLVEHCEQHQVFMACLEDWHARLDANEDCRRLTVELAYDMGLWLRNHLEREDLPIHELL